MCEILGVCESIPLVFPQAVPLFQPAVLYVNGMLIGVTVCVFVSIPIAVMYLDFFKKSHTSVGCSTI